MRMQIVLSYESPDEIEIHKQYPVVLNVNGTDITITYPAGASAHIPIPAPAMSSASPTAPDQSQQAPEPPKAPEDLAGSTLDLVAETAKLVSDL